MEHFEPLNASGTNDMVELWPSEISTLRISLWISPYGILPPIPIGTRVELRFRSKPELNGQRGVVTAFTASSGRCSVELEDGRGPFNIKPENLVVGLPSS